MKSFFRKIAFGIGANEKGPNDALTWAFNQIDDKIIKTTYDNSFEWFKQKIPLEVIDEMYKRLTKPLKKK